MTFEEIEGKGLLLYKYVRGSHSHGLAKDDGTSDVDEGGVFIEPKEWLLGLGRDCLDQVADETNDTVWYALKKYMNMLLSSNPTVLESLFVDDRFVLYEHPLFHVIKENRQKFITKSCFKPFIGYAIEQIKKCRSLHKMFLFEDIERKTVLDFVYTFHRQGSSKILNWLEYRNMKQIYCGLVNIANMHEMYGCFYDWGNHFVQEGLSLEDLMHGYESIDQYDTINLVNRMKGGETGVEDELKKAQISNMAKLIRDKYNIRSVEELAVWYEKQKPIGYRGMVKEVDGEITGDELRLSSVLKDEVPICHISYAKDAYSTHCKDYKNQQDWKKHRNPVRYMENKGKLFDRKNVAHAVRLLHMGKEIAETGQIHVDRTNIDRDFIMGIRLGDTVYEEIIEYIEKQKNEMEVLMKKSAIPDKIDVDYVNGMLIDIRHKFYENKY